MITRWAEFLDFYVAKKVPAIPLFARAIAAATYADISGTPIELPPDRFAGVTEICRRWVCIRKRCLNAPAPRVFEDPPSRFARCNQSWPSNAKSRARRLTAGTLANSSWMRSRACPLGRWNPDLFQEISFV
jgi:hypothetical protein